MSTVVNDEKTYELLRDKIKSKMDVAKFFAGFVSILLGIMLRDVLATADSASSSQYWLIGGLVLIVLSVALALAAVLAYDRLLMPPKFWSDRAATDRLNETLKSHMVTSWRVLFLPSMFAFFLGLVALASFSVDDELRGTVAALVIVACLLALVLRLVSMPRFEVPD